MTDDEKFMSEALDLAKRGFGNVSPNPMVGCIIVIDGKVVGRGWHEKYGELHAERNAAKNASPNLDFSKSTFYVTLEPCNHTGKTPPCTELLLELKPKRVVICNQDPNPLVAGKGIQKLREAGIAVEVGVLAIEGEVLNKRFFTFMRKQRPFIILKWAQTADGFIARENYDSKWISGETSRDLVHTWRAQEDAIMVGTNTAQFDNPKLNVRNGAGKNPIRIVIDRKRRLNEGLNLFDGTIPTLCYNTLNSESTINLEYIQLKDDDQLMVNMMADLFLRKVQSVIIEGGSTTLQQLIDNHLWDEIRLFKSSNMFEKGIQGPEFEGKQISIETVDTDVLEIWESKFE